ncbi:hypothetical protein E2R51_06255 [Jeotgalibacillus sp. S-D1]|uniref:hypothetical protein n=1 Tax=Jeotgalibacillus sp. S-D1 TaxID=2552189 RepID=UPI00105A0956|nr:hypothetical protein [Jeotgalibacillus sp. S-D1]TDL35310.1 hypothetical protein E2R51_06255 [Jeotgalibacillus sp. S-D1]
MRKWIGAFWLVAIIGAFTLQVFALLKIFPIVISSLIMFSVIFLAIIWATSKHRFRGFSPFAKRKF